MKEFLDQFTRRQIITAVIVAAVVVVEAAAYTFAGMLGVRIMTWVGVAGAVMFGVVYAVFWLIDYLTEREVEEHNRRIM